jgi:hypothetical protein
MHNRDHICHQLDMLCPENFNSTHRQRTASLGQYQAKPMAPASSLAPERPHPFQSFLVALRSALHSSELAELSLAPV